MPWPDVHARQFIAVGCLFLRVPPILINSANDQTQ
jgi:hypothetical protein